MSPSGPATAVVGAARGMGRETLLRLNALGHSLAAIDLGESCDELGYELGNIRQAELPAGVLALAGDFRDHAVAARCAEQAAQELGGIDQLVVTAGGIVGGSPLADTPSSELRLAIEFNLNVLHNAVSAFVPLIRSSPKANQRRIVAVASVAGSKGLWGIGAYVAAKHAVIGYLRTLALELAEEGIQVNWVSPGSTRTAMLERSAEIYGLSSIEEFKAHQRLGKLVEPAEIASAIAFLLSDEAHSITGTEIRVDAGMAL